MRALIVAVLLSLLSLIAPAHAEDSKTAPPTEALVGLQVNDASKGDVLAVARGDVLLGVAVAALELAGVPVDANAGFIRDGQRFVNPADLGPLVHATYDANQLILFVSVRVTSVQRHDFTDRGSAADFGHPSATLDYDLVGVQGVQQQLSLAGAVVDGRNQFVATGIAGNAYTAPSIFFERDDPEHRFEYQAGTFQSESDADMNSVAIVGLQGRRDFALAPLQPAYPLPVYGGIADQPSIADVYIGGVLARSVPIAPGPYALTGLGDISGSNVRIVLRDAGGIVRTLAGTTFSNITLLAAGTSDRSYAVGRDIYSDRSVADAAYRIGLTDRWTAGAHVRVEPGFTSTALSSDVSAGPLQFHLAALRFGDDNGYSANASLVGVRDRVTVAAALAPAQPTSRALGVFGVLGAERDTSLSVARTFGRKIQFTAQVERQQILGLRASESLVATANVVASRLIDAAVTIERDGVEGGAAINRFSLQFSTSRTRAGGAVADSSTLEVSPQGDSLDVRSMPTGDIGPHSELRLGQAYSLLNYGYASTAGTADATLTRTTGGTSASYEAHGGIGLIDGRVKLARTLDDSFAMVEVPGVPGTPIYANGRYAGRTGPGGDLLIGGIGAYEPTTIEIHPDDLAIDVDIEKLQATTVSPRRGGSVVRFSAHIVKLVQGRIARADHGAPSFATITFSKGTDRARAKLDQFDSFVVDRLTPGRWSFSTPASPRAMCSGSFLVPSTHAALVDVGTLPCFFGQ